jgi:hypothetical protein
MNYLNRTNYKLPNSGMKLNITSKTGMLAWFSIFIPEIKQVVCKKKLHKRHEPLLNDAFKVTDIGK